MKQFRMVCSMLTATTRLSTVSTIAAPLSIGLWIHNLRSHCILLQEGEITRSRQEAPSVQ